EGQRLSRALAVGTTGESWRARWRRGFRACFNRGAADRWRSPTGSPWLPWRPAARSTVATRSARLIGTWSAKLSAQLSIGQGRCLDRASPSDPPVSASPVPAFPDPKVLCRALSVDEIRSLTRSFAEACERAICAGFDLIWIHNHGGYLLD